MNLRLCACLLIFSLVTMPGICQPTSDDVINTMEELNIEDLTQQFRDFDLNKDGYNDAGEIRQAMPGITEDHLASIFNQFDLDMDGVFTLEEYLNLYNVKLKEKGDTGLESDPAKPAKDAGVDLSGL